MWVYRLGAEKAKRMLLTGDLITGTEAKEMGLVLDAVPTAELDDRVRQLAERMQGRAAQPAHDAKAYDQPGL